MEWRETDRPRAIGILNFVPAMIPRFSPPLPIVGAGTSEAGLLPFDFASLPFASCLFSLITSRGLLPS